MKNKYFERHYKKHWIFYQCIAIMLVFVLSGATVTAQVLTYPKVYFPLDGSIASPTRYTAATPGTKTDISAVVNGSVTSTTSRRGTANNALTLGINARLRIANATGSNTSTSFFGSNTATGYDIEKLTISCWVYVDPTETTKRYLFYGTDNSGKIGFGLSFQGADLYLSKYVNNATAQKGAVLPNPTAAQIGNTWEGKLWGPATFNAGEGWYQVILVQAPYYTRIFVGMPPNGNNTDGQGKKGRYGKDFVGSMLMHGKQSLTNFTKWGLGAPEGSTTAQPVKHIDDFMIFDYDMTPAEAEALYHCQVDNTVNACLGASTTYTSSFAIIGDYGCDGGTADGIASGLPNVATMVKSWNPQFILTVGDDSYHDPSGVAKGCSADIDKNVGQYYRDYIYPYTSNNGYTRASGTPSENRFFPVLGNHDDNCPTGVAPFGSYNCSGIWENYFPTEKYAPNYNPTTLTAPNNGRYYTFTQDNIQFFAINSNSEEPDKNWLYIYETDASGAIVYHKNCDGTDKLDVSGNKIPYFKFQRDASGNIVYTNGKDACGKLIPKEVKQLAPQAQWLNNSLSSSSAAFKVIYMHQAPYSSYNTSDESKRGPNKEMYKWPFKEWGADIVIAGDDHYYERNDYNSLTYLVNGVGGMPTFPAIAADRIVAGNRVHIEQKFGAVKVNYNANGNVLHFQFYGIDPNNRSTNSLMDEFYLYKRVTGATYLVENPVALQTSKEAIGITAYPNPTNGELNVRLQSATEGLATFKVLNLSGKLLYTRQESLTKGIQELNLGNLKAKGLATGIYLLQVHTPDQAHAVKIIIQ